MNTSTSNPTPASDPGDAESPGAESPGVGEERSSDAPESEAPRAAASRATPPRADAFSAEDGRDSADAVEAATRRLHARLQRIAIAPPDPHDPGAGETPECASGSSPDAPASNGLAKLVLTLVQLLHDVLERQAVRRMEEETLTPDEVERVGQALMAQAEEIERLCEAFGLDPSDLDIPLGSIHVDEPRPESSR